MRTCKKQTNVKKPLRVSLKSIKQVACFCENPCAKMQKTQKSEKNKTLCFMSQHLQNKTFALKANACLKRMARTLGTSGFFGIFDFGMSFARFTFEFSS